MNKKIMVAVIAIACLAFVSVHIFESLPLQSHQRGDIQPEKDAVNRDVQSDDLSNSQPYSHDGQQAVSDLTSKNPSEVEDLSTLMNQPSACNNQNEPTALIDQTNQGQNVDLPTPLPDGRIFLQTNTGTEDAIPYIPTENPKTLTGTPVVPLELDG